MTPARTTVVVVPREAPSHTLEAIGPIFEHTTSPVRLVVVDGGSPPALRRRLHVLAESRDFTLIGRTAPLTANEARNLALPHVTTEYVALVDNDTHVTPGWLDGLERCADETGASLVAPVVLWGPPDDRRIHYAGGLSRIEDCGRRLVEHNRYINQPVSRIASLVRGPSEYVELHCVLARTRAIRDLGASTGDSSRRMTSPI